MVDRMFYKFFSWIDSLFKNIEDICTFDVGQELKKKKKKKR